MYLFLWREKIVPTLGVVVLDLNAMRTTGKIFGHEGNNFRKTVNFRIGAGSASVSFGRAVSLLEGLDLRDMHEETPEILTLTAISWFQLENQNGIAGSKPVLKGSASAVPGKPR